jgi:hypothetical protein
MADSFAASRPKLTESRNQGPTRGGLASPSRRPYVEMMGLGERKLTMNRLASVKRLALAAGTFAAGAMALAFIAATPARADFAVVKFDSGYCQVWWDSTATPWGAGWSKIALGLPDADAARAVLYSAISQNVCR